MSKNSMISECPLRYEYSQCIANAAEAISVKEELRGATVLITGASGMVGGAISRTLLYLNRTEGLNTRLLLPIRETTNLSNLSGIVGREEANVFVNDLRHPIEPSCKIDYIIHAASPTRSQDLKKHSADVSVYIASSTQNLLELSRKSDAKGMVFLSSMEAFGAFDGLAKEDAQGYIDLTDCRSCYPEGKRYCENLVACYASQFCLRALSARLAQVLGAGIKAKEERSYADFALRALKHEPIVLRTTGESTGNYVHISDAITALLLLLVKGQAGEIYNVCGDHSSLSIKNFAYRISDLLSQGKSQVIFDIPNDMDVLPYAKDTGLILDNSKLKKLGWQSRFTLDDMILSLGKDLKEICEV